MTSGPAVDDGRATSAVVLVTGGVRGIGRAIAGTFAGLGGVVIRTGRSATPPAGDRSGGPGDQYVPLDLTSQATITAAMEEIRRRWGRLDVLVNNAGAATEARIPHDDVAAVTAEDWQRTLGTNIVGTWNVTAAALPLLRAAADPVVINISSLAGSRISGSSVPYAVSKAGVDHMTRLLAAALAPGIRVNGVAPGMTETEWTANWGSVRQTYAEGNPLRRIATPAEVADVCLGLYRSTFVTGVVVPVDGGRHLGAR